MFDFLRKFSPSPLLSAWVPYEMWLSPQVCMLSDGSACAAFEITGLPFETIDTAVLNRRLAELNGTMRNMVSDRLTLTAKLHHGLADPSVLPPPCNGPAQDLEAAYYNKLMDLCLYRNRLFLFLEWRPAKVAGQWMSQQIANKAPGAEDSAGDRRHHLDRACALVREQLQEYGLRRLGLEVRGQGVFNSIAEAEVLCCTGVERQIPFVTGRIGDAMFSEDIVFHYEHVEIRHPGQTTYAALLGMNDYMAVTYPGMMSGLLSANFTYTLVQSFRFMEGNEAEGVLSRKQNKMVWVGDRAAGQVAGLTQALSDLTGGAFVMGEHNLTLCVFAERQKPIPGLYSLSDVVNAAWRLLGSTQCVVAQENKASMSAWLSMLSGNGRYRVRPGAITSLNFAALSPMHSFPIGQERSRWGEPVLITRTIGGTPHRYHWHDGSGDSATGNTWITGEIGSGKTAGAGMKVAMTVNRILSKGGGWIGLDHKEGWHALTLYLGGSYMVLGDGEPCFAPLKALENTPRSLEFITALLRGCIRHGGWRDLDSEEDRRLALGVRMVMEMPPEQRSIGEIQALMGEDGDNAGARLRKWCWGEELGWVIDAPEDKIDMDGDINCFDTTRILKNLRARGPAMAYLFHRIELRLNGNPLLITMDEGWHVIDVPEVEPEIEKLFRTIRSKDGSLVLISQDPSDGLKSRIAAALVGQCPNQEHYVNMRAKRADYVDGLHMTEGEYAALSRLKKGSGQFLLRKGGTSSVQQIPMFGMDDWLSIVSASEVSLNALRKIPHEIRRDPKRFVPEYHRLRKLEAKSMEKV